ncbi:MAG TPA: hypothetical protein VF655_11420 [Allosphingosinicella sp.]|jgi:hypothetical protein
MTASQTPVKPRFITRWTSRKSLAYPALAPGYAQLDPRGLAGRVADMVGFAGEVPFVDLTDAEDGHWDALFTGDDAVLLAMLATLDVDAVRARADALIARIRASADPCRQERLVRELARLVLALAARLDGWIAVAERQAPGTASRRLFERLVADLLGPRLRCLLALVRRVEEAGWFEEKVIVIVAECGSTWFIEIDVELEPWPEPWLERAIEELLDAATAFLAAAAELVAASAAALEASLDEPVHAPQAGLLFAFAQVLGHAAESLNALPLRLADFYRQEVLRTVAEPALPDRVFAALTPFPVKGAPPPRIAQGTVFPAGRDANGKDIAFAAEAPLTVTGATISQLRLWQVEGSDSETVSRLRAKEFTLPPGGAAAAAFAPGQALPDAAIGFAVASPLLDLRSGVREVTLTLSPLSLPARLPPFGEGDALDVSHCFMLAVSCAAGWTAAPPVSAQLVLRQKGPALIISFLLPEDFPPLMPPAPPQADMPSEAAVRLTLVQDAVLPGILALALFGDVQFESLSLQVSVAKLGGLAVTTPAGVIGLGQGMMPFGSAPLPGATLRIDHPAFSLGIDEVTLELEWSGLPVGDEGFLGYYRQYVVGPDRVVVDPSVHLFTNDSFVVELGPATAVSEIPRRNAQLFTPKKGALDPISRFTFGRGDLGGGPGKHLSLALTEPAYGFGDPLYPINVANAAAGMAERVEEREFLYEFLLRLLHLLGTPFRLGWRAVKRLSGGESEEAGDRAEPSPGRVSPAAAMPNPPWRPVLSDLRVAYTASAQLPSSGPADGSAFFHVGAFGELMAVPVAGAVRMLPPGPATNAIDFRVSGWSGDVPLSILFLMGPRDPAYPAAPPAGPFQWSYGGNGNWTPVSAHPGFVDGTAGLAATGILTLPPLDSGEGSGDVWLRASFIGAPPPVARILPDALSAIRIVTGTQAALAQAPPESLRKPSGLAGIARVEQPLASFGGVPAGGEGDEYQRMAARTATRGRGLLAEDIERLALQRFPTIARIRLAPAEREGGALRLTIVPGRGGPTPPDPVRPRATAALRTELHDWVASISTPFARISVEDPVYTAVDLDISAIFADPVADPDRLKSELQDLLSPWADPGIDLDDGVGLPSLEGAIVRFVAARRYVASVVSVKLSLPVPGAGWAVPVPGALEISAISGPGGGC